MQHLMNPYWFVPFYDEPPPRLGLAAWGFPAPGARAAARRYTGFLEVRLRCITPVHVSGEIERGETEYDREGRNIAPMKARKALHRLAPDGAMLPVIEGASLRGMVRAWVEAMTNSMAGVLMRGDEPIGDGGRGVYARARDERHLGFWLGPADTAEAHATLEGTVRVENGIRYLHGDRDGYHQVTEPRHVFPRSTLASDVDSLRLDPATALFGFVTTHSGTEGGVHAVAGRLSFEDAFFEPGDLAKHRSLDLAAEAAFGGPKPSRSNWWYFTPKEIRRRRVRVRKQGAPKEFDLAEFVGDRPRGRKFYFHQDPAQCIRWYQDNWTWQSLASVETSCLRTGATSRPFRIHFRDLPLSLLQLLLVALLPSGRARHKVGALKPFGFGSVAFEEPRLHLEPEGLDALDPWSLDAPPAAPEELAPFLDSSRPDDERELAIEHDGRRLVHPEAWARLSFIGWCPENLESKHRLFVYPPYRQQKKGESIPALERGFARPIRPQEVELQGGGQKLTKRRAEDAVRKLADKTRRTIDLDLYQQTAHNYPSLLTSFPNRDALPQPRSAG